MPGLLLAPYNESMRLGQGYNSFLQTPCIEDAVEYGPDQVVVERAPSGSSGTSQVVSYSSRFVERISEVVRNMSISAGSSIKTGSVEISGSALSVDEDKFASSDLNAVVSVKVINQTTKLQESAMFKPIHNVAFDNKTFFDAYGDCYISGFLEGGDLHGIVSIEVLDESSKKEVEHVVKGQMNGANPSREFTLNDDSTSTATDAALKKTETTIIVNWSGGGQIKQDAEEWSLDSLFRVAASFPANVARCPQRTYAILTKYNNNRDFVGWASQQSITVPQFQSVQSYTSDLLDMFMEYKHNLSKIQSMLPRLADYEKSDGEKAIAVSIGDLITERKAMKKAMNEIVQEVDLICRNPSDIRKIEDDSKIPSPEVWATRLPRIKNSNRSQGEVSEQKMIEGFQKLPFLSTTATAAVTGPEKKEPPEVSAPPPVDPNYIAKYLEPWEQTVALQRRKQFFCGPEGPALGQPFCDTDVFDTTYPKASPFLLELRMVQGMKRPILGYYKMQCDFGVVIERGNSNTEVISKVEIAFSSKNWIKSFLISADRYEGVACVEIEMSQGRKYKLGSVDGVGQYDRSPPNDYCRTRGFWGCATDNRICRLGLVCTLPNIPDK